MDLLLGFWFRSPFFRLRSLPLLLLKLPRSTLCPPLSSLEAPPGFPPSLSSLSSSSFSSSLAVGDLADFQARVLGLSTEYQALGRWLWPLGIRIFALASHCPHLYSDFCADFASGSSRFMAALTSSASLPPSSVAPSVSSVSLPPQALVPFSSSLAPLAPPPRVLASSLTYLASAVSSSSLPPVSSTSSFSLSSWHVVPGSSGVAPGFGVVPVSLPVTPPVSAPSLFCPFAADPALSVPVPAAPLPSTLPSALSAPVFYPGASSSSSAPLPFLLDPSFIAPDELPEDAAPDALPLDVDSTVPAAFPESVRSEFRRMLSFLVDLFPQAAGAPSALTPPRALFEDFFGSSAPTSPVCLSWFERVRTALSDADSHLASFLSSGRADFSFLPPCNSSYAVQDEFTSWVSFRSLGTLLPRSNLQFPPRRGPPFGPSQLPIGFSALLVPCLRIPFGVSALVAFCFSPSLPPVLVPSTGGPFLLGGPCYSSSVGFPSGVRSQCLLRPSVVFLSGVSHWSFFCSLLCFHFLTAVPPWCCSDLVDFTFLYVLALPALAGYYFSCVCSL